MKSSTMMLAAMMAASQSMSAQAFSLGGATSQTYTKRGSSAITKRRNKNKAAKAARKAGRK